MSEIPTVTLYARCQSLCHWRLPLHASQVISDANSDYTYGLHQLMPAFWVTTAVHPRVHAAPQKEVWCVKSGDRAGQATGQFLAINLASCFSFKIPLLLCRNVEVPCPAAGTFVLVLQDAHPVNTRQFISQKVSVIRSCDTSLDKMWSSQVIAWYSTLQLTDNRGWKWHCGYMVWISCAQKCEFLVLVIPSAVKWASSVNKLSDSW